MLSSKTKEKQNDVTKPSPPSPQEGCQNHHSRGAALKEEPDPLERTTFWGVRLSTKDFPNGRFSHLW
jgi:hypothetical protein